MDRYEEKKAWEISNRQTFLKALKTVKIGDRISYMGNKGVCYQVYVHGPAYVTILGDNGLIHGGQVNPKYIRKLEPGDYENPEAQTFFEKWNGINHIPVFRGGEHKILGFGGTPGTIVLKTSFEWIPPTDILESEIEYWNYRNTKYLVQGWVNIEKSREDKWNYYGWHKKWKNRLVGGIYRIKDIWKDPEEAVL